MQWTFLVFCILLAEAAASRIRIQRNLGGGCAIISSRDELLSNGFTVESQDVHVCTEKSSKSGICYFTTIQKCCFRTGLELELASDRVTVGARSIEVAKLYAGRSDACVHFGSYHSIDACPTGGHNIEIECQEPVQICSNNSLSSCDPSGCVSCKEGYVAPSCCECEENYLKVNGVCKSICTQNMVNCANPPCCKPGYKVPHCCDCIYDENGGGENYFKNNGQCKQICKANALKGNCNVKSGCSKCENSFKPPDCCECIEPKQLVGGVCSNCKQNEMLVGGKCLEFARVMQSVTPIVRCWQFESCIGTTSIILNDPNYVSTCCEDRGKAYQIHGEESCTSCPLPPGICAEHVFPGSCIGTNCQCLTGYTGSECCNCSSGYIRDGSDCRRCPSGTFPDSKQEECICDNSQGTNVYVNGECISICSSHVVQGTSCGRTSCQCQTGYTGNDCCDCASNYIRDGSNCRRCPVGTSPDSEQKECFCDQSEGKKVYVNGECISVCENYVSGDCSASTCSCRRLFAEPDCCKCTDGSNPIQNACPELPFVRCWQSNSCTESLKNLQSINYVSECCLGESPLGRSYQLYGEESCTPCPEICVENIAQDDCNGLNCHCQTGYTGVGCCDCASGYFRDGSTCRGCPSGTVPDENQLQCICIPSQETKIYVKGQCISICSSHVQGECGRTSCQCQTGYTGIDCCDCDDGYVRNGSNCRRCPDGTVPDSNKEECMCEQSQEPKILVNGVCKSICTEHVEGTCGRTSCQCQTGYTGIDCCNCTSGYFMAGNTCRSCPPGLVLDSNQCVCDPSQGTNIYVNGECIPICFSHVEGECGRSSCPCQTGYTGNDCCDCGSGYVRNGSSCRRCPVGTVPDSKQEECICNQSQQIFVNGQCIPTCVDNVIEGECGRTSCQCRPGYTGNDCCDCASEYVLDGSDCTRCPSGTIPDPDKTRCICNPSQGSKIYVNEECIPICSSNVQGECTETSCQCQTGYTGNDCCDCDSGYVRNGSNCRRCPDGMVPDSNQDECTCEKSQVPKILVNGECISICADNVIEGECGRTSCQCRPGYTGNDCCDCASGYVLDGSDCTRCPSGTIPDPDKTRCICNPSQGSQIYVNEECIPICSSHVQGECTETSCQCQTGYTGNDCCDCDSSYVRNGSNCRRCPDGTVPNSNQVECMCEQSQEPKILVNGVCIPICSNNIQGECGRTSCLCQAGYTGDDCCNCASGYILEEEICKSCPPGTIPDSKQEQCFCIQSQEIYVNGECIPICSNNIVQGTCDRTSCQCQTGYTGNDCCDCDQSNGQKIVVNGECKSTCADHIQGECGQTSCTCQPGYTGNDCCDCASNYIKDGNSCIICPSGTLPDSSGTRCICNPSTGRQIYVNGQCKRVCENNILQCSERNCTCRSAYTSPDCCNCTTGVEPDKNGKCPEPCIDDQTVVFVMDRSTGIGQTELWGAMYAIEILTGALYRGSRNLIVSVVSYATTLEETELLDLTPRLYTNREVTFRRCINTLKRYERNIASSSNRRPGNTYSGKTIELLKDFIKNGTKTTVITFAGTLSNDPQQNLNSITRGIKAIKDKVGASNVKFFAAGFEAENFQVGEPGRKENYYKEVNTLADGNSDQEVVSNVENKPAALLKNITDKLYNNGVFCQPQRDTIFALGDSNTIYNNFYGYEKCVVGGLPCIIKPEFNGACNRTNDNAEVENAEVSLLTAINQFLKTFTN